MNLIPDEKQIENLLEHAAPQSTGWLEIRLGSAPWSAQSVDRRRSIQVTALVVLMISMVFAVTPQGRAFAQEFVSQFFTRTESDSYYAPYEDVPFEDTTPFHAQCGIPIFPTCSVEQIRAMVDFRYLNLLDDFSRLGPFDIVYCRNVLIYFDAPLKADVLRRIANIMAADGSLLLGASETVLGVTDALTLDPAHRGLYTKAVPMAAPSAPRVIGMR